MRSLTVCILLVFGCASTESGGPSGSSLRDSEQGGAGVREAKSLHLGNVTSQAPPGPEQLVSAFTDAMNHLSAEELRLLLTEEATAFLPFATRRDLVQGRDAIVSAFEPLFDAERKRLEGRGPQYLNLRAQKLVVQRERDFAVLSFDVGTEAVASRRTIVAVWRGDTWRIAHLHASNIRPD